MELARGYVKDRPWGQTLGALGIRQLSGQLSLQSEDGKQYCIAFERGAVVGATSPLSTDSAVRVALTAHLIPSVQVPLIQRQVVAHPELDEFELIAKTVAIDEAQLLRLRQRTIAQRAARTFAVTAGSFFIDDAITIPASSSVAVDIRAVVFMGARLNIDDQRLLTELRSLGHRFRLKPNAEVSVSQYGASNNEVAIIHELASGTTLSELEAKCRTHDPRTVQALLYSLVSCLAVDVDTTTDHPATQPPVAASRTATTSYSAAARMPRNPTRPVQEEPVFRPRTGPHTTITPPTTGELRAQSSTTAPLTGRVPTQTMPPVNQTAMVPPRTATTTIPPQLETPLPRTQTLRSPPAPTVPPSGPPVARTLSPTGAPTTPRVNTPTLSPKPDANRTQTPTNGPPSVVPARTQTPTLAPPRTTTLESRTTQPMAVTRAPTNPRAASDEFSTRGSDPLRLAAEAYQRGQDALREAHIPEAIAEFSRAAELNPHEFDYAALLAWAQFRASTERERSKIADKTRKMLTYAMQKSRQPELPRLCLGRMELLLGHQREALVHFKQLVQLDPQNTEAAEELRVLQEKLAAGSGEKPGIASLFRRKSTTKGD